MWDLSLPPKPFHERLLWLQHRATQRSVLFLQQTKSILKSLLPVEAVPAWDQAHSTRTPQHCTINPRIPRASVATFFYATLLRIFPFFCLWRTLARRLPSRFEYHGFNCIRKTFTASQYHANIKIVLDFEDFAQRGDTPVPYDSPNATNSMNETLRARELTKMNFKAELLLYNKYVMEWSLPLTNVKCSLISTFL